MGLLHWTTPCHCNTLHLIRVSHCIKHVWVVPRIVWSLPFSPFSPCTQAFVCLCFCVRRCVYLGLSMCAFEFVSGLFSCVSLGLSMRASMSVRAFECLWCFTLSVCGWFWATMFVIMSVFASKPRVCYISHCSLSIACGGQSCLNYCPCNLQYVVVRVAVCNGNDH